MKCTHGISLRKYCHNCLMLGQEDSTPTTEGVLVSLVFALQQYANKNNWGFYDDSGCPKGEGEYEEACFIGLAPAQEALQKYKEWVKGK